MKRSIRNMLERAGGVGRPPRAFTLLELLIAVGALALISVGVAAIFEATGRTVQTGRRVSAMASYATLIERRMREDFSSMTRDGFLIIKHMYADGVGDGNVAVPNPGQSNGYQIPLDDTDLHPRLRRTDEIMFFMKGQFVSARELLDGRFVAKADAAALYYGHGQKAYPQPYSATEPYYWPNVGDAPFNSNARLGFQAPSSLTPPNPNQYASNWILVRHMTLLRPAQTSGVPTLPRPFGLSAAQMADSDIQVSLQPAESNMFRWLSHMPWGAAPVTVRDVFDAKRPQRGGGLVDIATTDLSEIKAIITTADKGPGSGGSLWTAAGPLFFTPASNAGLDGNNAGVDGKFRPAIVDTNILAREQAWMDDALPAGSTLSNPQQRYRIRCESAPNNYVGVLSTGLPQNDPELPSRRADQLMLSASNFLPHCTEFIVEWSFGHQYPSDPADPNYNPDRSGQLVWYGLERRVNGQLAATFYQDTVRRPWDPAEQVYYTRVDGTAVPYTSGGGMPEQLIHRQGFSVPTQNGNPGDPLTSFFGYTDPTFNPDLDAPSGVLVPDGKLDSPGDSRSSTIPWPWPKFIRITMSLADPNNPSVEQSFQFVFDVPAAQ